MPPEVDYSYQSKQPFVSCWFIHQIQRKGERERAQALFVTTGRSYTKLFKLFCVRI